MTSTDSSREVEAIKQRLAAAKTQVSTATKNVASAKQMSAKLIESAQSISDMANRELEEAKAKAKRMKNDLDNVKSMTQSNIDTMQSQLEKSQKEVQVVEKLLAEAEERALADNTNIEEGSNKRRKISPQTISSGITVKTEDEHDYHKETDNEEDPADDSGVTVKIEKDNDHAYNDETDEEDEDERTNQTINNVGNNSTATNTASATSSSNDDINQVVVEGRNKRSGLIDQLSEAEKNEAIRQYAQYRSAPDQFPSYDRLRFVRLPQGWLPEGLRDTTPSSTTNNNTSATAKGTGQGSNNTNQPQLQHWPCLVYQNLAELVRDLSPDSSERLKAKFMVEHRKAPQMVLGRLLGWDNDSASSWKNGQSDKPNGAAVDNKKKMKNRFAEPRIELIKLSGYTLEEHDVGSRVNDGELLSFVDSQLEFENVCEELIVAHVANKDGSSGNDKRVVDVNVARHAYQFRNAVDMALNCLALDLESVR